MTSSPTRPVCGRIREAREEAGLTQEQVAAALAMSVRGYSAYERNREPTLARLTAIANAVGTDVATLISDSRADPYRQMAARISDLEAVLRQVEALARRATAGSPSAPRSSPRPGGRLRLEALLNGGSS